MTVINNNKVIIICNNYYKLKKINDKIIPTKVLKYIAWSSPWWLYFTAFPQPFSSKHILHNSCARKCNPSNTFHTRDLSGPQERAKHGRAWGHERDWMNDPQSQGVWDWVDRETANIPIKSQARLPSSLGWCTLLHNINRGASYAVEPVTQQTAGCLTTQLTGS